MNTRFFIFAGLGSAFCFTRVEGCTLRPPRHGEGHIVGAKLGGIGGVGEEGIAGLSLILHRIGVRGPVGRQGQIVRDLNLPAHGNQRFALVPAVEGVPCAGGRRKGQDGIIGLDDDEPRR